MNVNTADFQALSKRAEDTDLLVRVIARLLDRMPGARAETPERPQLRVLKGGAS